MAAIDPSRQYLQSDLPSEIFNSNNGDIKDYNGQSVKVGVNGNGTRNLSVVGPAGYRPAAPITPISAVDTAQQLQDFQVKANQPAIATLQGQVDPLKQRYSDLLDSIKGQGSVAVNAQTLATNNELGRRGLASESGIGQQQIASSLLPVTTQYAGLTAQTGMGEQQDLLGIANQIAGLQRGDPVSSITGASNILGIQQQAANIAAQNAAAIQQAEIQAQGQRDYASSLANAQIEAAKIGNTFKEVNPGGSLYNVSTGGFSTPNGFTPTSLGNNTSPWQIIR